MDQKSIIKYGVVKRKNPMNSEAAPKFYPTVKLYGNVSEEDIIQLAAQNSNIDPGVLRSVMVGLSEAFENYLYNGHSIDAYPLGCFNMRVSSNIYSTAEALQEAGVDKAVRTLRIRFLPSMLLKEQLSKLKYEKDD